MVNYYISLQPCLIDKLMYYLSVEPLISSMIGLAIISNLLMRKTPHRFLYVFHVKEEFLIVTHNFDS